MLNLDQIAQDAAAAFAATDDPDTLEQIKARYLGKSGQITELLKGMAKLSPDEKKSTGAAINRAFSLRAIFPHGTESEDQYAPGLFYCKDAFEGLAVMDRLVDPEQREALVAKVHADALALREKGPEPEELPTDDDSVRSAARTDNPVPTPPFWGVREIPVDMAELYHHLDTHVLFKLHWGGRGVKGEAWRTLVRDDFRPRLERMWREQDYLRPRALHTTSRKRSHLFHTAPLSSAHEDHHRSNRLDR